MSGIQNNGVAHNLLEMCGCYTDSYCKKLFIAIVKKIKRRFGLDLPYTHKSQTHSLIPFTSSGLDSHSNYKVEL